MARPHDRPSGLHAAASVTAAGARGVRRRGARPAGFDPLSDVLRTVRLTGALFFLVEASDPWGIEVPAARSLRRHRHAGRPARGLLPRDAGGVGLGRMPGLEPARFDRRRRARLRPRRSVPDAERAGPAAGVRRRGDARLLPRDGGRAAALRRRGGRRRRAAARATSAAISAATSGRSTRCWRPCRGSCASAGRRRRAGTARPPDRADAGGGRAPGASAARASGCG